MIRLIDGIPCYGERNEDGGTDAVCCVCDRVLDVHTDEEREACREEREWRV